MKNYTRVALSLSALAVLVGCGSSGPDNKVNTGTGYYQDEAIVGVDYKCGSQIGKTGEEGKFTFEVNSGCSFSVAGIPLKSVKADELKDGGKVFEDNEKVVQFLASIDDDGKIENGLTINNDMLTKLEAAVKEIKNPEDVIKDNTTMATVVESTGKELVPEETVEEHLNDRREDYVKALIEGKTLYFVDGVKIKKLTVGAVKDDTVTLTFSDLDGQNTKVYHATIEGKSIIDEDGTHVISKDTQKYIIGYDKHGEFKLYYNLDDAKAELKNGGGSTSTDLYNLLAGHTYYQAVTDAKTEKDGKIVPFPHVEKWVFSHNGTYTDSWEEGGKIHTYTFNYEVLIDNKLRIYGTKHDSNFDVTLNFEKQDNNGLYFNGFVLYNSEDIAKNHLN